MFENINADTLIIAELSHSQSIKNVGDSFVFKVIRRNVMKL